MSLELSAGVTTWWASTSSCTHWLSGLVAFHCAISASETFWPSARVLGASFDTCTVVLLSQSLTVLLPDARAGDCCGAALGVSAFAASVDARTSRAKKLELFMALLRSSRSITGEGGRGRDIGLAAAAQIAGLDLHGIAVPQAVEHVDEAVRVHRDRAVVEAVIRVEGIRPMHRPGARRHSRRGVGPGPGAGQHAVELDIADAIGQHLMRMPVQHRDAIDALQQCLDVLGVVAPELPRTIELVERAGREHDQRRRCRYLLQIFSQPLALHGA